MQKSLKWRFILTGILILGGAIYLVPTFKQELPDFWQKYLPKDKIHLGLDLQGGIHLIMEVEAAKAVESTIERSVLDLKETMRKQDIFYESIEREGLNKLQIRGVSASDKDRLEAILTEQYGSMESSTAAGERGVNYTLALPLKEAQQIQQSAVDQALETIRNRIDQYGVSEPTIQREAQDRILVQLPGVKDPERAIKLIGQTAMLEFKVVDAEHSLEDALKGQVPAGSEILYQRVYDPETNRTRKTPLLIKKKVLMTGDVIANAQMAISGGQRLNQPYVSLTFNPRGARIFDQIAEEHVNQRLAIILDNNVYSAPVIKQTHYGGRAVIEGNFTADEAHDLAIVLRAGSLPAPVRIAEQRVVGPSLGSDSIRKGLISVAIATLGVFVFMVFYYSVSGIIADISLLFLLLMVLASLVAFKATLTLPGIAGLVLTMGMAVDANVLIYERIREELRMGKSSRAAIEAGFHRAWPVIMDANLTTLISGLVLFQFGTGPVKGFAVTLSVGIVWTLVMAVFFTRELFDYLLYVRRVSSVPV
jgi:preprotein translocase subunit SecD